jgi:hypothetical protein
MSEQAIQALMTHADKRTTQIYRDRGAPALSDGDFHPVVATVRVADVMERGGK